MEVKIKKLNENAVIPRYAHPTDAGLDLVATSYEYKSDIDCHVYGTDLAVEIPEGYVGLIYPRSSNRKTDAYMTNHVGVIDSGYRGEIMCTFRPQITGTEEVYNIGDKVCQLIIMPYPQIMPIEATELSETERGEGGHGSTGK